MITHRKKIYTMYGTLWKIRKLMEFQYKVIHNVITLNPVLCKMGIKESNLCTFCNRKKETIYHIFYRCTKVNSLWNQVRHWFNNTRNGSFISGTKLNTGLITLQMEVLISPELHVMFRN